jgi:hypothetical protein
VEGYAGQQFVGIDLHRRRSVIVRMTEAGEVLESTRILNDAERLASVLTRCGEAPEVVMEATYGWYWAADVIAGTGARLHLAHPLGVKAFEYRRVKNDERDATDLADLLRMGRLPEAWIAPPVTRELRELVRHRAKLVALRSHCKAEIHAVSRDSNCSRESRCPGSTGAGSTHCDGSWTHWNSRSRSSPGSHGRGCRPILVTWRCRAFPGSARHWPRCSSPGSGMSTASPARTSWPAGPG